MSPLHNKWILFTLEWGGYLLAFAPFWNKDILNPMVPICNFQGLLKINSIPSSSTIPTLQSASFTLKQADLWVSLNQCLAQGVVILVPAEENVKGFYSNLLTKTKQRHSFYLGPKIPEQIKILHSVHKVCECFSQIR